jgi:IPT/TIG domain
MFEMNTYHSIYMVSPKVMNWTKTHGGPYYAEVGKNINVEYTSTSIVNVTTFNNATN